MKLRWFCLAVTLFAGPASRAQQVSVHAQKAVETIRELRKIGIPEPTDDDFDDSSPGPPARVPGLLRTLNQELKELIVEYLNDPTRTRAPSFDYKETEILDRLRAAGWEEIPYHKWESYGEIEGFKFGGVETRPDMAVVSTRLWIPCPDDQLGWSYGQDPDSAVYVFHKSAQHWDLVLGVDADFDESGDGGVEYKVSEPDSHGHWFLVVARTPPTCRRNAQPRVSYEAVRPGSSADQPTVLVKKQDKLNPFFEEPLKLDVHTYSFAVTYGITRKMDDEPGIAVAEYGITGDQAQRIGALALTPEDFLDQWVQMRWDEASRWTETRSAAELEQWHAKLSALAADSVDIQSVQSCNAGDDLDGKWLIHLAIDQPPNPEIGVHDLYVGVSERDSVFFVTAIHATHPSGCPGKTPPTVVTPDIRLERRSASTALPASPR